MAALGSAFRMLTRRGIFQTSRAFSLGSTSRASVAVVSIMFILKQRNVYAQNILDVRGFILE